MRIKERISLLLCMVLLISLLPMNVFAADGAKVASLSGTVTVKRANSEKTIRAFTGMALKKGDIVTTGAGGSVVVDIGSDKTIKASGSSSFSISDLKDDGASTHVGFTLIKGTVYNEVRAKQDSDDAYTVQTGNTVMGVRGTEFIVRYEVVDGVGRYLIVTLDGQVFTTTLDPVAALGENARLDIAAVVDILAGTSQASGEDTAPIAYSLLSKDELEFILNSDKATDEMKKEAEKALQNVKETPAAGIPETPEVIYPENTGDTGGTSGGGTPGVLDYSGLISAATGPYTIGSDGVISAATTIASGAIITVVSGVTLNVNATLTISGEMVNQGSLNNNTSTTLHVAMGGIFTNIGTMTNGPNGSIVVDGGASFKNHGTLVMNGGTFFSAEAITGNTGAEIKFFGGTVSGGGFLNAAVSNFFIPGNITPLTTSAAIAKPNNLFVWNAVKWELSSNFPLEASRTDPAYPAAPPAVIEPLSPIGDTGFKIYITGIQTQADFDLLLVSCSPPAGLTATYDASPTGDSIWNNGNSLLNYSLKNTSYSGPASFNLIFTLAFTGAAAGKYEAATVSVPITFNNGSNPLSPIPVNGANIISFNTYAGNNTGCSRHYKLTENVDMAALTSYTWTPIGSTVDSFTGTFDGDGNTISNLTVSTGGSRAGMFGWIGTGGKVSNLTLEEARISNTGTGGGAGGIAGMVRAGGTIENCAITGTYGIGDRFVEAASYVGGIAGENAGTISGSSVSTALYGDIYASNSNAGGIAGYVYAGGEINNCTVEMDNCSIKSAGVTGIGVAGGIAGINYGTISGSAVIGNLKEVNAKHQAGGIAGVNYSTIEQSYSSVNVTATDASGAAGGIAGVNSGSGALIENCYYAEGVVKTSSIAGGIAGKSDTSAQINFCYAYGKIALTGATASPMLGGIVGWQDIGSVANCVAMQNEISATAVTGTTGIGRIAGIVDYGSIADCYAWYNSPTTGMYYSTYGATTYPTSSDQNSTDGADMNSTALLNAAFWSVQGFDPLIWTLVPAGELPSLTNVSTSTGTAPAYMVP